MRSNILAFGACRLALLMLGAALVPGRADAQRCESISGRCLYAAPGADGSGSVDSPGSIEVLLPQLEAGDTLYLREGIYSQIYRSVDDGLEGILVFDKGDRFASEPRSDAPITVRGYPGERAVLEGNGETACVQLEGHSHLRLADFHVRQCFNVGMRLGGFRGETDMEVRNVEVSDVRYFDNSGFISAQGVEDLRIVDSRFHDYIYSGDQQGYYLKFFQCRDVRVEGNELYGEGGGLYYKHGEAEEGAGGRTEIVSNHFHGLSGHAILLNQNRTRIEANLIEDGFVSLHREDGTRSLFTTGVRIVRNTFIRSGLGLSSGSDDGSYLGLMGLGATDTEVRENIFYDSPYDIWRYGSDARFERGIDFRSDDNCFYRSEGELHFDFFENAGAGAEGGRFSFMAWQGLGFDRASRVADPEFDDARYPSERSPCSGQGRPGGASAADAGPSLDGGRDMGGRYGDAGIIDGGAGDGPADVGDEGPASTPGGGCAAAGEVFGAWWLLLLVALRRRS